MKLREVKEDACQFDAPGGKGPGCSHLVLSAVVFVGVVIDRYDIGVGSRDRTLTARRLPVGLFAQQRLTEPVELGDHLLRCRVDGLTGFVRSARPAVATLRLEEGGDLVLRQATQLLFASRTAARRSFVAAWASRTISRHSAIGRFQLVSSLTSSSSLVLGSGVVPVWVGNRPGHNAVRAR